jgi:hypothetical protein
MNSFFKFIFDKIQSNIKFRGNIFLAIKKKNIEQKYGLFIVKKNSKSILTESF